MSSTIRIPPTLRAEVGGERQVAAEGGTVREVLGDLMDRFPGLATQLVEDGDIAPFVNVYVEGEDVRTLDGMETPVADGATVILLPAMAGGEGTAVAPSCAEGGVLGVLPGIVGSLQAREALKLCLGVGDPLVGRLLLFDALATEFNEVSLRRDPNCPVCGDNPTITEYVDYVQFCSGRPAHA